MLFPIMNVARHVIYKICNFLDIDDLSLMREVNKHLKSFIDHLIEHGTATVHGVNISHVGIHKAAYDIVVQSSKMECFIWKLFLISEIGYDEMRQIHKRASSASRRGRAEFRLVFKSGEDLISILEKFANRVQGRVFGIVQFHGVSSAIIRTCSGVLDGNRVMTFTLGGGLLQNTDYAYWIGKMQLWKVHQFNLPYLPTNTETVEFILRIANEVEKLSMSMQPMAPVWLIKEILRRKVYDLNVFAHAKSSCSLKEVENFIKILNNSVKKLRLVLRTYIVPSVAHYGLVKLTAGSDSKWTEIAHVEMSD
ncbi:hypothetical protein PRIPAC_71324 [Pristionchus pacificus]|uniref:Uncharacterized protein n=1 Tax=Pristionchus pacificus TaxID=54126 RepID=A0A2A6C0T8_PRIPA|nr:hypothetical protein PRIPAC_71324 [Pristionchus pacificus]|eukprot:PDM71716.1 hypothetical protein PRIPAC_38123 [Pristionchus pacificus]